MKPYSELANANIIQAVSEIAKAIVLSAIDDYRRELKWLNYLLKEPSFNGKRIVETKREIDKIEEFFRSEWYSLITNISGDDVIRKIRMEAEQ